MHVGVTETRTGSFVAMPMGRQLSTATGGVFPPLGIEGLCFCNWRS